MQIQFRNPQIANRKLQTTNADWFDSNWILRVLLRNKQFCLLLASVSKFESVYSCCGLNRDSRDLGLFWLLAHKERFNLPFWALLWLSLRLLSMNLLKLPLFTMQLNSLSLLLLLFNWTPTTDQLGQLIWILVLVLNVRMIRSENRDF